MIGDASTIAVLNEIFSENEGVLSVYFDEPEEDGRVLEISYNNGKFTQQRNFNTTIFDSSCISYSLSIPKGAKITHFSFNESTERGWYFFMNKYRFCIEDTIIGTEYGLRGGFERRFKNEATRTESCLMYYTPVPESQCEFQYMYHHPSELSEEEIFQLSLLGREIEMYIEIERWYNRITSRLPEFFSTVI